MTIADINQAKTMNIMIGLITIKERSQGEKEAGRYTIAYN